MAKNKLKINASEEQLNKLYAALGVGTPITIALSMAGFSRATYYYWVAIYSVVVYCKEQEELEEIEQLSKAGISIQEIKDMSETMVDGHKKSSVESYIEPKQETILQYKNSRAFQKFADQVYEIIAKCNRIRSEVIVKHLNNIAKSTDPKNRIKASGSMWFLERTQADYFGRPSEKAILEESTPTTSVPSIQVEFVNPDSSKNRLEEMEMKVLKELKGTGEA